MNSINYKNFCQNGLNRKKLLLQMMCQFISLLVLNALQKRWYKTPQPQKHFMYQILKHVVSLHHSLEGASLFWAVVLLNIYYLSKYYSIIFLALHKISRLCKLLKFRKKNDCGPRPLSSKHDCFGASAFSHVRYIS